MECLEFNVHYRSLGHRVVLLQALLIFGSILSDWNRDRNTWRAKPFAKLLDVKFSRGRAFSL